MSWLDSYTHRALLEAALVGAVCGAIGVHVVLRRMGFFTMAMTHATFPGVVLAAVAGIDIYLGGAAMGVLICLCVLAISRRHDQGATTATGIVLAAGFALGVALLSASNGFSRDLESFMTGSIVTVTGHDLAVTAGVGALVLLVLAALHKELMYGAFDPDGQRAAGYPVTALDLLLLVLIEAVIIVTAPAIGVMLAMALIVGPAATARLWTDRIGLTVLLSVALGTGSCALGLALSTRWDLATGGTITLVVAVVFLISLVLSPHSGLLGLPLRRRAMPTG
ncbi:metal ABC transporter permease [Streptomyces sp. NL15-2K]|uniref:metal ABC transporter permease n=1 Tax=Streptomyces sp. NL15-2K TaxID=376149 RepID=UPI000F56EC44|nr:MULTISPECIES: metal ABC transporter permease [Actinomycetes]WKX14106.1 metal ABC transporter permease [Kutzneria buriramensis]GCB44744.1 manganese ABC transporter [Streptomyces sp. NL15-2K]